MLKLIFSEEIKLKKDSDIDFTKIKHKIVEKYRELSNKNKNHNNNSKIEEEVINRAIPEKKTSKKELAPIKHVHKRRLSIAPKYHLNKGRFSFEFLEEEKDKQTSTKKVININKIKDFEDEIIKPKVS